MKPSPSSLPSSLHIRPPGQQQQQQPTSAPQPPRFNFRRVLSDVDISNSGPSERAAQASSRGRTAVERWLDDIEREGCPPFGGPDEEEEVHVGYFPPIV
ncbi:hypothetical protein MBM_09136 [Drepanopeziza brunnea f. sp. 'multigermtubi' MB_m1]|uniref:Uncharacterized protein n=1 Tax=Marssonina brunnea f. sp. multigermtubi (strain MB_m1) TaxID=1072389 RepID=K1WK11_MARBU|nr:uncharacterized protein MBM_09136 [Drepanopeziza brunnea f. sp. 'multigermtubi' MB_m1]EKD12567.1 hypothetical protein MBM_09136 [Drepanopeziza brunnea f. sp. 'multigermtubi' MB_m1]